MGQMSHLVARAAKMGHLDDYKKLELAYLTHREKY